MTRSFRLFTYTVEEAGRCDVEGDDVDSALTESGIGVAASAMMGMLLLRDHLGRIEVMMCEECNEGWDGGSYRIRDSPKPCSHRPRSIRSPHHFRFPIPHLNLTMASTQDDGAGQSSSSATAAAVFTETNPNHFTHLLLGTSLSLSILSAALSLDPQNKILHVDTNDYYGSYHASLTLTQLVEHLQHSSNSHIGFPYFHNTTSIPPQLSTLDRHYSLSLSPALQPASSTSSSLDTLIRSNVAKYATFRLLQRTALYDSSGNALTTVPSSKEDIFKSTSLSLLDKRKLMKFLQSHSDEEMYNNSTNRSRPFQDFLREQFKLPRHLIDAIAYGIAHCQSEQDSTEMAMQRVRTHLASVGRYGNSAHLVAQYGGMGDIVQGYCRASAVKGSTFILGKDVQELSKIDDKEQGYSLKLRDIDEVFTVDRVIGERQILDKISKNTSNSPSTSAPTRTRTLQSIFILDRGINIPEYAPASSSSDSRSQPAAQQQQQQPEPIETALLIFPPFSLHSSHKYTTTALSLGEGTFCCPKGQYVVHATTSIDAEAQDNSMKSVHQAVKDKILQLTKGSSVEWTQEQDRSEIEGDGTNNSASSSPSQLPLPLVEGYWLQSNDSTDDILTWPPVEIPDLYTPSHIATLFDDETTKAERVFYALHGIYSPPYPNPRTKTMRHDDEYRGRGGVGPDYADEADDHQQHIDGTSPQPLFFPLDQDATGDQQQDE